MADKKRRVDKIFNNSYHVGTNLKEDFTATREIKINKAEIGGGISQLDDFDNHTVYSYMERVIIEKIKTDNYFKEKFNVEVKKKFNKEVLNEIFGKMKVIFLEDPSNRYMFNVIYLFDILSSLTGIKTKTLFDFLKFEYKSELVSELDKSINILGKTSKMF